MKKNLNYLTAGMMFLMMILFLTGDALNGYFEEGKGKSLIYYDCFYYLSIGLWFFNMCIDPKQRSLISISGTLCSMAGIVSMLMLNSINLQDLNPDNYKYYRIVTTLNLIVYYSIIILIAIMFGKSRKRTMFKYMLGTIMICELISILGIPLIHMYAFKEGEIDMCKNIMKIRSCLLYVSWGLAMLVHKTPDEDPAEAPIPEHAPIPAEDDSTELGEQTAEVTPAFVSDTGVLSSGGTLQNGRYRIEGVLGQGGFGITYKAVQTGLNRKVAIKEFFMKEFCDRDATSNRITMGTEGSKELVEKFKNKFIKEAQVIADMQNDHIVRIYDVFEENNTAYYVMEYISGGNLAARISGTPTEENVAYGYVRQICDALKYLHERNILHLDIKPSNIMFRDNNELVLIDFGISKHYDKEEGSQTSSTPIGISRGYAPLEQYKSGGVSTFSPATDIYSVGATLYNMVTGQLPPEAEDVNEEGLEPFPCEVSEKFRNAIVKAMEPRRRMRPQSIDEFMNLFNS